MNFFIYPYAEVDGMPHPATKISGVEKRLSSDCP
jgi:hypothetical protein